MRAADDVLASFPPTRLGPDDMNLTSLYKPPSKAPAFLYNPRKLTQEEAEAYCQTQGGHLAAYISKQEQYLVEQTLVNKVGGVAWPEWCAGSSSRGWRLEAKRHGGLRCGMCCNAWYQVI